ncbi:hypothetical protein J5690_09020 [bacterium]|nr:hypothetical protein [bacterium]
MKFVCNNCGFAAEIPVKRTNCPMCGSSNVSSSDEILNFVEQPAEESEEAGLKTVMQPQGPTQRVTLTDDLIRKDEKTDKKTVQKAGGKSKLPIIAAITAVIIAAVLFFLMK